MISPLARGVNFGSFFIFNGIGGTNKEPIIGKMC